MSKQIYEDSTANNLFYHIFHKYIFRKSGKIVTTKINLWTEIQGLTFTYIIFFTLYHLHALNFYNMRYFFYSILFRLKIAKYQVS